jgi:hypothetical protein
VNDKPLTQETTLSDLFARLHLEIDTIMVTIEKIDQQPCDSTRESSYYTKGEAYFEQLKTLRQLLYGLKSNTVLKNIRYSANEKNKEHFKMLITKIVALFEKAHIHRMHTYEQGLNFFPALASQIVPYCFIDETIERYMQSYVNQQLGSRPITEEEYIANLQHDPYFSSIPLELLKEAINNEKNMVQYKQGDYTIIKHIPPFRATYIPLLDITVYFKRMRDLEKRILKR